MGRAGARTQLHADAAGPHASRGRAPARKAASRRPSRRARLDAPRAGPTPTQVPAGAPMGSEVFEALKDDPDLADVFEDVKAHGVTALQK